MMDISEEEIIHGVKKYMSEFQMILPIFLGDDPECTIGRVEYAEGGGVRFHLSPEFMETLSPNVREFRLSAHYKSMLEPPVGISLTPEY